MFRGLVLVRIFNDLKEVMHTDATFIVKTVILWNITMKSFLFEYILKCTLFL